MIKVLAYCAFLNGAGISLPDCGLNGATLEKTTQGELNMLWSPVEWPFEPATLQRSAVEFHQVVSHVFAQTAVVPFRLLSVFDDRRSLEDFLAAYHAGFVADLERLQNLVQMECVLYFAPQPGIRPSGKEYLERKAELLRHAEKFIHSIRQALGGLSRDIHIRESKNGSRIFVLMQRGNEAEFRTAVQQLSAPERLARRTSGPWPPAEFLSDAVKLPQIAGGR